MSRAFKRDDEVQLIAGGPIMTITQMGAESPDQMAWCVWEKGRKKMGDAFAVSTIMLAPDDPPARQRS